MWFVSNNSRFPHPYCRSLSISWMKNQVQLFFISSSTMFTTAYQFTQLYTISEGIENTVMCLWCGRRDAFAGNGAKFVT